MEVRKFRKKYDLELIPAGNAQMKLGDLVWDGLIGKPKFDRNGMSNNVFNVMQDMNLLDSNQAQDLRDQAKNIVRDKAKFAQITVDLDIDATMELEHETIGKLGANFDLSQAKSFSFEDLQAQVMPDQLRMNIDNLVDEARENNWRDYDGKIRRAFIITELYYGSISIKVDTQLKANLESAFQNAGLNPSGSTEIGRTASYNFTGNDVPFAMRIERLKNFNG
jgi:hypothetical protein